MLFALLALSRWLKGQRTHFTAQGDFHHGSTFNTRNPHGGLARRTSTLLTNSISTKNYTFKTKREALQKAKDVLEEWILEVDDCQFIKAATGGS